MVYLAMTAAEFKNCDPLPANPAWMACHFSPYGTGITNIPTSLPPNSLLILNDRTPVHGHDPIRIRDRISCVIEACQCAGLLLDLQRGHCEEATKIVEALLTLPCPVCVSDLYAKDHDCPVFLPPVPLLKTAEEYLSPWRGREIWLESALEGCQVTVTETGSNITPLPEGQAPECPNCDMQLFCHYGVKFDQKEAVFTLKRQSIDLQNLQKDAEKWGVTHFVGLWQELK